MAPKAPRLTINGLIILFSLVMACIPALIMLPFGAQIAARVTKDTTVSAVHAQGTQQAAQLAKALYQQWREVEVLASFAQLDSHPDQLKRRLETVKALNDQYAWLGIAAPNGKVAVATGGVLEGQSVAQRPWFEAGLQGPFAGDVHGAVLLQSILAPNSAEPLRLVDFAVPVRRPDGVISGVIGSHLDWKWVRNLVLSSSGDRGMDIILVARDGKVLVGPESLEGQILALPSLLGARASAPVTNLETWPDGQRYFTVVVPSVGYRNMPSFGWSLIVRQPEALAFTAVRSVTSSLAMGSLATAALILLLGFGVARFIQTPLRAVARDAADLAHGRLNHSPTESMRYAEVATLSGALSVLQSRLTRKPTNVEDDGRGTESAPHLSPGASDHRASS